MTTTEEGWETLLINPRRGHPSRPLSFVSILHPPIAHYIIYFLTLLRMLWRWTERIEFLN
jgi:hypothetical protein